MPRSYEVVLVATLLVEGTELDEAVAHYVGVRRQSRTYLIHSILRHLVPVLPVAVYHLQPAPVFMRHRRCHLHILLRRAVPFFILLRTYLNIEAVRLQSPAGQFIDHHRRVHAARQQHSNPLIFQLGPTPSSIVINHISFRLTRSSPAKIRLFPGISAQIARFFYRRRGKTVAISE